MTGKNVQRGNWHFSLRSLFLWTIFVALPLGCFLQYYMIVADTIDKRTVPLVNAPGVAIAFLGVGLLSIVLVCVGMLVKRSYKSAIIFMASLLLGVFFGYPFLNASLLRPKQGNHVAELHNDAASLTAMAIKNYYERVGSWPRSWQDLDQDIKAASVTPNAVPGSMGVPQRVNLAANLPIDELVNLVDVDFAASPELIAKETWSKFTGIRPQAPSYNLYRVHFQELIDTISASKD